MLKCKEEFEIYIFSLISIFFFRNNWNAPAANNRFRGNRFGPGPPMRGGRGGNFGRGGGRGGQNNRFDGNWAPNSGPGPQNMNFGPPPHMNGPPGFPPPQMVSTTQVNISILVYINISFSFKSCGLKRQQKMVNPIITTQCLVKQLGLDPKDPISRL